MPQPINQSTNQPIKLIYLVTIRLPTEKAHGLQIIKTCEALAKEGMEVELIVPKRKNNLSDDPFAFYGVEKNFTVTKISDFDFISSGLFGSLGYWLQSWFLYRKARKRQTGGGLATVVYYTRDLPLALSLAKHHQPFFYEIHSIPGYPSLKHRQAWVAAKGLVVISEGLKKKLQEHGIGAEKILLARDAVDVDRFHLQVSPAECRQELGLPLNKKIVVYTGHLYAWKGAHLLAEAAAHLPADIKVYLVGGTPDDIASFRKAYHSPNLHIVGFKSHDQIPRWLRAADLLVLPTSGREPIGARYTSPLKLFEYIASGTPIVAADLPSIKEILSPHSAVFFQPDSAQDLAQKIISALQKDAYDQLVSASKNLTAYCAQEYTWAKRAQHIKEFIV